MGLDEKLENLNRRGGFTIMEIRGHGGRMHFGNSEGKGGYGTDIFWNRPIKFCTTNTIPFKNGNVHLKMESENMV